MMEKSYLSRFFDEGMDKASSLIDGARKTWDSIDFDAIKEKINTYASSLYDSAMKFGGKVKDSFTDFKLTIPFDAEKQKFNYKVENDILKLKIKGRDGSNVYITEMTVPQSCIAEHSKYKVDREKKTLTIIIPKDLKENEDLKGLKQDIANKTDDILGSLKEFVGGLMAKKEHNND